ncbi:OmpA family protein [Scytonema millei]|uniref:OmpA family protein n=1 Tax=Scytonema millei VB511283 TaxID=1245923 RepID=A0A9X5E2H7_9CYAN|nr:phosphate ABC transporter substrate-binding/OmpA family protein [Scytonema millei]NHC33862.1 OmpA family protein [Scytonema millei VB511283]
MKSTPKQYHSINCQNCGHINSIALTHCQNCHAPLNRNKKTPTRSFTMNWSVVPLIGILALAGILYLVWKTRSLPVQKATNTNSISTGSENTLKQEYTPLLASGNSFSGYSTFRSPELRQALKKLGIDWRYQLGMDEMHFSKQIEQLNQGKTDLAFSTLDEFLLQKVNGKVVGLIDRTMGGDAVILNTKKYPKLRSLQDLTQLVQQQRSQGKLLDIAFTGNSPSEYLALLLSAKFEEFQLSDFQIRRVEDAADAWKLIQDPRQNVAVAVVWEPYVTQAQNQGYTVVLSSGDAQGAIVDVIIASNRLIQSQPDKLSDFLAAYYRRVDADMRDASRLKQQIAQDGQLSAEDAIAVIQGIKFFTATEAQSWLTDGTFEKRINSTAAILTLAGKMEQVPTNPKNLFTPQFVTQAANNTQTLIDLIRADNPTLASKLAGQEIALTPRKFDRNSLTTAPNIGNLQVNGNVKFAYDSATLTPEGKQTLDRLAAEMSDFNDRTVAVRVIGHTSRTGLAALNQKLSQQRSQVVANYLKSRLKLQIVAEGKGFRQPLSGISPQDPRNQRTEIRLVRVGT